MTGNWFTYDVPMIVPLTLPTIQAVLREPAFPFDIELKMFPEIYGRTPDVLAYNLSQMTRIAHTSRGFIHWKTKEPLAFIQVVERFQGDAVITFMGHKDWQCIAFYLTYWLKNHLPNTLVRRFNRVEVRALDEPNQIRWLKFLGAQVDCILPGLGPDGEDFLQLSWRKEDVRRRRNSHFE